MIHVIAIEMLIASCMAIESSTGTMKCAYHHSEWWEKSAISSYYPEKSKAYSGDICWVKDENKNLTLIAESCKDFKEKLRKTVK